MQTRVQHATATVFLMWLVLNYSNSANNSYSTDTCTFDNETKTAYCDNLGLTGLPDLPEDVEVIFARNNSITTMYYLQLHSLRELYLSNNRIKGLTIKTFVNTPLLRILDLSHNNFGEVDLDSQSFYGLEALKTLRLSYNGLTVLHAEMFGSAHFPKVELLDLSFNDLHTIRGSPFDMQENLHTLLLNNNKIKRLSRDTFKGLVNLNSLNLQSNELTVLPARLFTYSSNCTNISLDLSYNRISKIHPDAFVSTESFGLLNLSHNNLKSLPLDSLSHTKNVHTLVLDSNPVPNLPNSEGNPNVSVEILSLCSMPVLTIVGKSAFLPFRNLRTILVENNHRLKNISEDAFKGLNGFKHVSLRNCSLETLKKSLLSPLKELASADLSENKWNCNCSLVWLPTTLMQPQFSKSRNWTRCFKPSSLRGKIIVDLEVSSFSCVNWIYTVVIPCSAGGAILFTIGVVVAYRKRRAMCSQTRYRTFATEQMNEQY